MNFKNAIFLLLMFLCVWGCAGDENNDSTVNQAADLRLKLGMQEVHFSQRSEVEGWGFADINQAKALFDLMDDLKISRFRYTIFWTSAEIDAKNNFVWTRHDELINYLAGKGINLTVTLFGDNYLYDPGLSSPYPGTSVDGYWNAWLNFVEKAVVRYGDKVDRWEIWNEPDFGDSGAGIYWKPGVNAANFTAMMKGTAQRIKSLRPGAQVVMGGVTNFNGYRLFLKSCFDAGMLDYVDEVGVHLYRSKPEGPFDYAADTTVDINSELPGIQPPTTFSEEIASLRSFLDSYRKDFPVRNTEEGFHIGSSAREDFSQMKYLTRMILVERSLGIQEVTCFRLRAPRRSDYPAGATGDSAYNEALKFPGIIDQNADGSFTPRPAYYGIKNMAKYLVDPDVFYQRSLILDSGGYKVRVEIYAKNSLPVIAYWIEEAIDNAEKKIRNISLTIDGIGVHSYRVTDIKDDSARPVGPYSAAGSGVSFSSLPVTDYPFVLSVE